MAGRRSDTSPGHIRDVLASNRASIKKKTCKAHESISAPITFRVGNQINYLNKGETVNFQCNIYSAHMACITFRISQHDVSIMDKALIDRGANVGIYGDDMLVVEGSERLVDVFGLAGQKVSQLWIITAQALISTHKGDFSATFHQMAILGKGKSILSCLQMEAYGADINDQPCTLHGGKQRILIDGYQIPLVF
jgi:hypothetical protein